MAHGRSRVTLDEEAGGTRLRYAAEAAIGGKLGQIGGRLIDASVQKMAGDFFGALERQLNPQAEPVADATASTALSPALAAAPAAGAGGGAPSSAFAPGWSGELQRLFWLALGLVLGMIFGALASRGLHF
jgi:hypothetical protein